MSLRTRFIVVLLLFCFGVGVNIYAAIWCNRFLLADATAVFETAYRAASLGDYLNEGLQSQHILMIKAFGEQALSAHDQARVDQLAAVTTFHVDRLARVSEGLPYLEEVRGLQRNVHAHELEIRNCVMASSAADFGERLARFETRYQEGKDRLRDDLRATREALREAQNLAARDARSASDSVNMILLGMAAAELVVLVVVLSLFTDWMVKPIEKLRVAADHIASGNLDYRLAHDRNDELGALSREINQMAASLSKAQKELKKSERMAAVGEMVSVVAHNIRNPLAGIRATAQASRNEAPGGSQVFRQLERIIATVDSLEQWLKELLHLNRPLELKLEATRIDDLVADLQQIFQPTIQRKKVEIVYKPAELKQEIHIDRQHFVQAMSSILDNAIEATPAGSAVNIEAGPADRKEGRFYIEIRDAGIGVPDSLKSQVFEPYFSTKPGGTGIGLSMAKKIIEAHSGRLRLLGTVDGRYKSGAVFRIELPGQVNGRQQTS